MSTVQVKVRQQPCNWQAVRHLLPAEFSSCGGKKLDEM